MNHTIRGIIIVVVITSMLVVGATTVPIMQNSFAHKRSDFKGAERDPNTNTNTNTNSADSSSSSNATADNTNNIDNTATASSNQNQNACAVAVTCPQGSTTVTPPTTGTLSITKTCGPVDEVTCVSVEFPITVTGNNPQPRDFTVQLSFSSPTVTRVVTLDPGSFRVTESVPQGFSPPIFEGNCDGTISAGQSLTCTIRNQPGPG
jgi:Sec-independent protein translocase protein TatA